MFTPSWKNNHKPLCFYYESVLKQYNSQKKKKRFFIILPVRHVQLRHRLERSNFAYQYECYNILLLQYSIYRLICSDFYVLCRLTSSSALDMNYTPFLLSSDLGTCCNLGIPSKISPSKPSCLKIRPINLFRLFCTPFRFDFRSDTVSKTSPLVQHTFSILPQHRINEICLYSSRFYSCKTVQQPKAPEVRSLSKTRKRCKLIITATLTGT